MCPLSYLVKAGQARRVTSYSESTIKWLCNSNQHNIFRLFLSMNLSSPYFRVQVMHALQSNSKDAASVASSKDIG